MKPTPNNIAKMKRQAQIHFDTWGEEELRLARDEPGEFAAGAYDHKTIADWVRFMSRHDEGPDAQQMARDKWAYRPDNNVRPSIEDIARKTTHVLREYGERPYSGTVEFYKDEIDVKGDGSIWAETIYEVSYNWTHDPGDRVSTPPISDFDVQGVRVKDAVFFTNDGEEVEIDPEQANKALVNYFSRTGLDSDESLAEKIHEQAQSSDY